MRIALFSPFQPTRSGIASYTAALLPWMAQRHEIDLFTDEASERSHAPRGSARAFSAHDIVWRHARDPYDLIIYQLGNSPAHDYMWPYLVRYAGLVVIHDGNLQAARGHYFLSRGDVEGYRAEFAYEDPRHAAAAELVIAGVSGTLRLQWPMLRAAVSTARTVAVHNQWLAEQLRGRYPDAHIEVIRPGIDDPVSEDTETARAMMRARHGLPPEAVVFGAFGWVTPEKRVPQILRAMAGLADREPGAHLLLVGSAVDHYDVRADLQAAGLEGRVTVAGYVDDADVLRYLSATDVCLCLRWPSMRETSATWLRALAAGKNHDHHRSRTQSRCSRALRQRRLDTIGAGGARRCVSRSGRGRRRHLRRGARASGSHVGSGAGRRSAAAAWRGRPRVLGSQLPHGSLGGGLRAGHVRCGRPSDRPPCGAPASRC